MKSFAVGLAAALFAAALAPVAAHAADKPDQKAEQKKHQQGMADMPALIQQTGISCMPSDAVFMGEGKTKDAAGKDVTKKLYEVACQEGLGYIITQTVGGSPDAFDCMAMSINAPKPGEKDNGKVYCKLPANSDPLKGFAPIMTKAGVSCTPSEGKYVGSSPTDKLDEYEIACSSGQVYLLQYPRTDSAKKLVAADCMTLDAGQCALLPKDKYIAALAAMAAPSGRPCQVSDGRYIGTSPEKHSYFEVACGSAPGYVLEVDAAGKYVSATDCARASSIAGGCTLTTASAAQTQEDATYTKLAQQVGYPCNVKGYRSLGRDQATKLEVVELACSDHADGAYAMLPVDPGQKGDYFNCVRAELRGLKCVLTPADATYAKISSEISATGHMCQVTNARAVGKTSDGTEYIEVTCSGEPGKMIAYAANSETVKQILTCGQASGIGDGCKLGK